MSIMDHSTNNSSNLLNFSQQNESLADIHIVLRDPLYVVIPVTIIYISIFVTGTIGNIITCIVIARNKSMHTTTNYYLFSLAVSDLLLLISGVAPEIYMIWYKYPYIFGHVFCVLRGLAAETSMNASVLTITAFTVERYLAICHPFLSQTMSKLTRAVKLILIVWLVAFSFAVPVTLELGIITHPENSTITMCTVNINELEYFFEVSTFLFFVIPMIVIIVLYALIGFKLRRSNMMKRVSGKEMNGSCRHHPGRSSRRVLKMLVAVVIAFFICWVPFHVQRLIAVYGTSDDHITSNSKWMEFLYSVMTYTSGPLYYVSATINPILYNIMSNKFRVAFMETLSRSWRIPGLRIRNEQRSYSSLSRTQQRVIGGSKTVGTVGTGIVHESTDCSRNSVRENSPKQQTNLNKLRNIAENRKNEDILEGRLEILGRDNSCLKRHRYTAVKLPNVDESGKKWWHLLKWFPGLKSFKFAGRGTYGVPENRTVNTPDVQKEEILMTMWNETNETRPV